MTIKEVLLMMIAFSTLCIWLTYLEIPREVIPRLRQRSLPRWKMVVVEDAVLQDHHVSDSFKKTFQHSLAMFPNLLNASVKWPRKRHFYMLPGNNSSTSHDFDEVRHMDTLNEMITNVQMKKKSVINIVWYRPFHSVLWMHTSSVDMSKCSHKNCKISYTKITTQNDTLVFNVSERHVDGDVILFQGNRIAIPFPIKQQGQVFVLVDLESPGSKHLRKTPLHLKRFKNAFNWTMTFRSDSDIPFPYGKVIPKDNSRLIQKKNYSEIFRRKLNKTVWIASHCNVDSRRRQYVELLQKQMTVDIYGACGERRKCSKPKAPMLKQLKSCEAEIASSYKFYLAFENTLCRDYITEKVFRWYSEDIVLVVRGAPNYSKFLPPGTYIDTADFNSTKDLGEFLNKLADNEKEYINYLKTKDMYQVERPKVISQRAYCEVCEKANNAEKFQKSYVDIKEWLNTDMCRDVDDLI